MRIIGVFMMAIAFIWCKIESCIAKCLIRMGFKISNFHEFYMERMHEKPKFLGRIIVVIEKISAQLIFRLCTMAVKDLYVATGKKVEKPESPAEFLERKQKEKEEAEKEIDYHA